MNREIADLRASYYKDILTLDRLVKDPIKQFEKWFKEAKDSGIVEPNAMTLSTVSKEGIPSSRVVLLKELDEDGFVFYTNYQSAKGKEMAQNPNVSLVFLWKEVERQVRISGKVEKISRERSNRYFNTRPKSSRIGAYVSPQSEVIESREILENRQAHFEEKFKDEDTFEAPEHWGGYKIIPSKIEFWQGRPSRLHDRLRFTKQGGSWLIERLAP